MIAVAKGPVAATSVAGLRSPDVDAPGNGRKVIEEDEPSVLGKSS
jgi:hypothetical protein